MASMRPTPKVCFPHNFGFITESNIIQVAIPRCLGPANQMVPSAMTSHGRHIEFQDGRHEAHHETFFCHNFGSITDTNIIIVAIPRFLDPANKMVPSAMTSRDRHIGFQDGHHCKCMPFHIPNYMHKRKLLP
jgi:hypothetical protein